MGKLWFNGTIYTMEKEGETVEAIYSKDGFIMETGAAARLREKYSSDIEEMIDLKGKVLFPGFVDSHMHLIGYGETFIRLDFSAINNRIDVLNAIEEKVQQTPAGQWILGEGWNENLWDSPAILTRTELDKIAPHHPVMLKRVCRHAVSVNSKALMEAGINEDTPNPEGGIIDRDEDGRINGFLLDQAQELIFAVLPMVTQEYIEQALEAGIENAWKRGLVGGHTEDLGYYGGFTRTYLAFKHIIEDKQKRFRANLLIHHTVIEDWKKEAGQIPVDEQFIESGAMKIFADGALGGRTALLSHPYADDPTTNGVFIHPLDELKNLVKKARQYGLPVAVHVIGDLAFEYVLDAITEFPAPSGKRDRLIHAQILRKELIERAKPLSLILDIQPRFVASDFPWVIERIGKEKMKYNYAWKTLLEEGLPCAGGSDAPIEPADPLLGIHAAVARTNPLDHKHTVYGKEQRLTVFEAISLFTKGSAYAICHEHDRGLIKAGYTADFTVLDKDLFKIPEHQIPSANVSMTVVGEERVYEKQ